MKGHPTSIPITTSLDGQLLDEGTAWLVGKELVVTAAHVITCKGAVKPKTLGVEYELIHENRSFGLEFLEMDAQYDVALLKLKEPEALQGVASASLWERCDEEPELESRWSAHGFPNFDATGLTAVGSYVGLAGVRSRPEHPGSRRGDVRSGLERGQSRVAEGSPARFNLRLESPTEVSALSAPRRRNGLGGMSGAPVIQEGWVIGILTHAIVNLHLLKATSASIVHRLIRNAYPRPAWGQLPPGVVGRVVTLFAWVALTPWRWRGFASDKLGQGPGYTLAHYIPPGGQRVLAWQVVSCMLLGALCVGLVVDLLIWSISDPNSWSVEGNWLTGELRLAKHLSCVLALALTASIVASTTSSVAAANLAALLAVLLGGPMVLVGRKFLPGGDEGYPSVAMAAGVFVGAMASAARTLGLRGDQREFSPARGEGEPIGRTEVVAPHEEQASGKTKNHKGSWRRPVWPLLVGGFFLLMLAWLGWQFAMILRGEIKNSAWAIGGLGGALMSIPVALAARARRRDCIRRHREERSNMYAMKVVSACGIAGIASAMLTQTNTRSILYGVGIGILTGGVTGGLFVTMKESVARTVRSEQAYRLAAIASVALVILIIILTAGAPANIRFLSHMRPQLLPLLPVLAAGFVCGMLTVEVLGAMGRYLSPPPVREPFNQ